MSLLYRILYAAHANGTHHKLALRALEQLSCDDAAAWRRVFLKHAEAFMEGAKAPDVAFKDFENHVLHVDDGDWGGAREAATKWYRETVERLRAQRWRDAAYAGGVLSHYISDPLMPLHTGGSEAEANIHRAAERSISAAFESLWDIAPEVDVPVSSGRDWLAVLVRDGARIARPSYWPLIARYDFDRGATAPQEGFDAEARSLIAPLLAHAAVATARALDRAFIEAGVEPPSVSLSAETVVAGLRIPARWVAKRLENAEERALVLRMHAELSETGRVERTLTDDVRQVRDAVRARAAERSKLAAREAAAASGDVADLASRRAAKNPRSGSGLSRDADLERAPSIGPKTAARLSAIGVRTVGDLLAADPRQVAAKLKDRRIDSEDVATWRDQVALLVRLPRLRNAHAVMLVAAGYRDLTAIAGADPTELRAELSAATKTEQVRTALRDPQTPDLGVVVEWIGKARGALAAA